MTWISFFTTSYQKTKAQTDRCRGRQAAWTNANTRAHTNARTDTHTYRHDEKFQLFSAMRQCILSSRSNISHLGEKHSPQLLLQQAPQYTSMCYILHVAPPLPPHPPPDCIMWPTLTVVSKNCIMRTLTVWGSPTFSLRLRALMTFAAKVRPEEFSTHLCTWPKRPLKDREEERGTSSSRPRSTDADELW